MYRFLLRPKWIAFHVLVVAVMVAMVNLGLWQLRRLHERRSFNAAVEQRSDADISPLAAVLGKAPNDAQWRRVEVAGTFLATPQFEVVNRSQGGVGGRNVVNGLITADGTTIIVNRGFVAADRSTPPAPSGTVTILGRVRASERRRAGQAADDPVSRLTEIRRIDLDVLRSQFTQPLASVYLEELKSTPADAASLQAIPPPQLTEGPHLSYTIQWFTFTVCVGVGWVLAVRRSARTRLGLPPRRQRHVPILEPDERPADRS